MRAAPLALLAVPLLLVGCSAAPAPIRTVTVTATPPAPSPASADTTPWDLQALCAAESEVSTLVVWRDQQTEAGRLSVAEAGAVRQAIAVAYLGFDARGLPEDLSTDVAALRAAAGALERPTIDLDSASVTEARQHLADACQAGGYPVGVLAQGG